MPLSTELNFSKRYLGVIWTFISLASMRLQLDFATVKSDLTQMVTELAFSDLNHNQNCFLNFFDKSNQNWIGLI